MESLTPTNHKERNGFVRGAPKYRLKIGYSLHYFDGDYGGAIGGNNTFIATQTATNGIVTNSSQLYNGNIGRMVTTITNPDTRAVLPVGNAYKYDQLNRLSESKSFNNMDLSGNSWNTGGTTMYYNKFTYDANGNIKTQLRYDETATGIIDQLSYNYKDLTGAIGTSNPKKHNRLYNVQDVTNYDANDIDPSQVTNNYTYDAEGRLTADAQEKISLITWRADGKVKKITRNTGFGKKNLSFDYDAFGHRVAKHVYTDADVLEKSTYYILDAQGNTMSTYERVINSGGSSVSYTQTEKHIYGASRIGVHTERIELLGTLNDVYSMVNIHHHIGNKAYEFTNHLGNVLSVISDKVIPHNNSGTIDYWLADLRQATDYSPFGVMLHNRDLRLTDPATSNLVARGRFGFIGMEMDNEIHSGTTGNAAGDSYDFGARMLDPRLGRWLTIDPLSSKYPNASPYNYSLNSPIQYKDPNGEFIIFSNIESVNRGKKWLVELGIDNEFKINKHGVLKKKWTPFTKNDDLTKSIKSSYSFKSNRRALEVSFSENTSWSAGWVDIESDVFFQSGSGSTVIMPSIHSGIFDGNSGKLVIAVITKQETQKMCDVNTQTINSEASEFVRTFAGIRGENLAREKLGLDPLKTTEESLKYIHGKTLKKERSYTNSVVNSSDRNTGKRVDSIDESDYKDYTKFRYHSQGQAIGVSSDGMKYKSNGSGMEVINDH